MQDYKFEVGDTFEIYFPEDEEPQWYKAKITVRGDYWVELSIADGKMTAHKSIRLSYDLIKNYKSKN